jgi:predicted nucleotide-binding protein
LAASDRVDVVAEPPFRLFLASSVEGRARARDLRSRLPTDWSVDLWDEGIAVPGSTLLDGLLRLGGEVDFAVLVLSGDDELRCRGQVHTVPRDNVLFEAGLFIGLVGPARTLLVEDERDGLKLPSDLAGITRVRYRSRDGVDDDRAAVDAAAREVERAVRRVGRRVHDVPPSADHERALEREVDKLARAAQARGWTVVRTASVVRIVLARSPDVELRLALGDPLTARRELRLLAVALHKLGVRVAADLLPQGILRR